MTTHPSKWATNSSSSGDACAKISSPSCESVKSSIPKRTHGRKSISSRNPFARPSSLATRTRSSVWAVRPILTSMKVSSIFQKITKEIFEYRIALDSWKRLQVRLPFGLDQTCFAPISEEEVVILGGRTTLGDSKESFLFNMRTQAIFEFPNLKGDYCSKLTKKIKLRTLLLGSIKTEFTV